MKNDLVKNRHLEHMIASKNTAEFQISLYINFAKVHPMNMPSKCGSNDQSNIQWLKFDKKLTTAHMPLLLDE